MLPLPLRQPNDVGFHPPEGGTVPDEPPACNAVISWQAANSRDVSDRLDKGEVVGMVTGGGSAWVVFLTH
jgi:hypothetical protein